MAFSQQRLVSALASSDPVDTAGSATSIRLGVISGQGVGPEVVGAALAVLDAVAAVAGLAVEVDDGGLPWVDGPHGPTVSAAGAEFFDRAAAARLPVLCGAVSGRFVYELRRRWDLFCKFVPVRPLAEIADASIVRPERSASTDLLVVRDNASGIYQGAFGRRDQGHEAFQEAVYRRDDVDRILSVAARAAAVRSGRLTVVVKRGGIPTISELWVERAHAVTPVIAPSVTFDVLDVDNACFQAIADPRRFDVVVTPNLIGDVFADTAAVTLGSRGMSWSANFRADGWGVFQTGHGAAWDLAGTNTANPVAQIQSLAAMLSESYGLDALADLVDRATAGVLGEGMRTADIAGPESTIVGTRELGDAIATRIHGLAERAA